MLKSIFNSYSKSRGNVSKQLKIYTIYKNAKFSFNNKGTNNNKRVKLFELISDKKGEENPQNKKIRVVQKSEAYVRKQALAQATALNVNNEKKNNEDHKVKLDGLSNKKFQEENTSQSNYKNKWQNFNQKNQGPTGFSDKEKVQDYNSSTINNNDSEEAPKKKIITLKSSKRPIFNNFNKDSKSIPNKKKFLDTLDENQLTDIYEDETDNKDQDLEKSNNNALKTEEGGEEEILRYMCLPLNMQKLDDVKYKWQQFFVSSQRVIPDINRSINNIPDSVYYEYIRDLIDEFTDKQLLFAMKNVLLNADTIKTYDMLFIFKDLFFRLKSHGTFNLSSKLNVIMLYEVFFLFDLIEYKLRYEDQSINTISGLILQMVHMVIDYHRFYFAEFSMQENLMILKAMMDKNVIDIYLVKKFLIQYSELDIVNSIKSCIYKIKYFNTEYNLNLCFFYILDNFVKICRINKEFESINDNSFKYLVKRMLTEVK